MHSGHKMEKRAAPIETERTRVKVSDHRERTLLGQSHVLSMAYRNWRSGQVAIGNVRSGKSELCGETRRSAFVCLQRCRSSFFTTFTRCKAARAFSSRNDDEDALAAAPPASVVLNHAPRASGGTITGIRSCRSAMDPVACAPASWPEVPFSQIAPNAIIGNSSPCPASNFGTLRPRSAPTPVSRAAHSENPFAGTKHLRRAMASRKYGELSAVSTRAMSGGANARRAPDDLRSRLDTKPQVTHTSLRAPPFPARAIKIRCDRAIL